MFNAINSLVESGFRRFARYVSNTVVARPEAWNLFRPLFRRQWDRIAPTWDATRRPDSFDPYNAGLDALPHVPTRALDIGTGTGGGALAIASHFPTAHVIGVDLSGEMVARAAAKLTPSLAARVAFRQGDASSLPFGAGEFDLVAQNNMIPFFDEIARVLRPGGYVMFAFSRGSETPIYTPPERLRSELDRRDFTDFALVARSRGIACVARKQPVAE